MIAVALFDAVVEERLKAEAKREEEARPGYSWEYHLELYKIYCAYALRSLTELLAVSSTRPLSEAVL